MRPSACLLCGVRCQPFHPMFLSGNHVSAPCLSLRVLIPRYLGPVVQMCCSIHWSPANSGPLWPLSARRLIKDLGGRPAEAAAELCTGSSKLPQVPPAAAVNSVALQQLQAPHGLPRTHPYCSWRACLPDGPVPSHPWRAHPWARTLAVRPSCPGDTGRVSGGRKHLTALAPAAFCFCSGLSRECGPLLHVGPPHPWIF